MASTASSATTFAGRAGVAEMPEVRGRYSVPSNLEANIKQALYAAAPGISLKALTTLIDPQGYKHYLVPFQLTTTSTAGEVSRAMNNAMSRVASSYPEITIGEDTYSRFDPSTYGGLATITREDKIEPTEPEYTGGGGESGGGGASSSWSYEKERSSPWPWVIGGLLLLAVATSSDKRAR